MRIYVISLRRSVERRASIERQFRLLHLDYQIVDSVDGRDLRPEERAQYSAAASIKAIGRELCPEEIGCALSHLSVYRRMLADGEEALILEDDALVDSELLGLLASQERYPPDWELIFLCHHGSRPLPWGRRWVTARHKAVRFRSPVLCSAGYLLNSSGARKLLDHAHPIRLPSDGLTGQFRDTGVVVYGIVPTCVALVDFPTTIGSTNHRLNIGS